MMGQAAHLRSYLSIPDCEIVALAEPREDVRTKVAARYGIEQTYADGRDMVKNEELDGIVASQPFCYHASFIKELTQTGKPIFIEKPLARSLEAGEEILSTLAKNQTWCMVGYHKRCDPAIVYAKAEIERLKTTEELGKLKYLRIQMPEGDFIAGGLRQNIESNSAALSTNRSQDIEQRDMDASTEKHYTDFVNYYIHQVNLIRHLLGEDYQLSYVDPEGLLAIGHTVDTKATCQLEMTTYRTSLDWQENAFIAFEHGYIKVDLPAPLTLNRAGRVEIFKDPGNGSTPETVIPQMPWLDAMQNQAETFVRAIRGETTPPCEAPEAYQDLQVAREYIRLLKGI